MMIKKLTLLFAGLGFVFLLTILYNQVRLTNSQLELSKLTTELVLEQRERLNRLESRLVSIEPDRLQDRILIPMGHWGDNCQARRNTMGEQYAAAIYHEPLDTWETENLTMDLAVSDSEIAWSSGADVYDTSPPIAATNMRIAASGGL